MSNTRRQKGFGYKTVYTKKIYFIPTTQIETLFLFLYSSYTEDNFINERNRDDQKILNIIIRIQKFQYFHSSVMEVVKAQNGAVKS